MLLKTKVFELYPGHYRNLSELAHAMGISVSEACRVRTGKRSINQKFIIGAFTAFPGFSFDDLFYFAPELPVENIPSPAGFASNNPGVDNCSGTQEEGPIILRLP